MGRHGYPPESRRKVLELVETGRPIAEVARALGISDQSIYTWHRQDRIDRGLEPVLTSPEKTELLAQVPHRRAGDRTTRCAVRWGWSERWCPQRRFQPGGPIENTSTVA